MAEFMRTRVETCGPAGEDAIRRSKQPAPSKSSSDRSSQIKGGFGFRVWGFGRRRARAAWSRNAKLKGDVRSRNASIWRAASGIGRRFGDDRGRRRGPGETAAVAAAWSRG